MSHPISEDCSSGLHEYCTPCECECHHNLQHELLGLITLMPDSQTKELVDYILGLKAGRRMKDADSDTERLKRQSESDEIRIKFNDYWRSKGLPTDKGIS